jgi:hypothetical protein
MAEILNSQDTSSLVLTPRANLQVSHLDGELILFDPTARQFHRLNPTAAAVWLELDGVTPLAAIATRLADAYQVDQEIIEADCATLAADFDEQKLLGTSGPPSPPPAPWVPALEASTSPWRGRHEALVEDGPWAVTGGPYRAFGFRFTLVCDDAEIGAFLAETLAPVAEEGASPDWPADLSEARTYLVRRPRPSDGTCRTDPAIGTAPTDGQIDGPTNGVDADDESGPTDSDDETAPTDGTAVTGPPDAPSIDSTDPGDGSGPTDANDETNLVDSTGPTDAPDVPPLDTTPAPPPPRWRLFLGGRHIQSNARPANLTDHLLWHVNRMAVETDTAHTMFHAAGASWNGAGILIPGHQNAGKSTLVTGLVEAGLGYLGDEAIALHPDTAWMLPLHKAIGLDRGSWPVLPHLEPDEDRKDLQPNRWHVPPDRVRPGSRSDSVPVRFIVCPRYEANVDTELQPMSDVDTVALLLEQAFHLADRPDALEQLVGVVEPAECHRLLTSSLAESVRLVCELVGAPGPQNG